VNAGNLAELLQMLQGTQKNWVAHIALPEAVASGAGEPWKAKLTVIEGKVTCQVWSSVDKRVLLTNDGAIRWLATLPRLSWSLEPIVPPMASIRALHGSLATLVQQVPQRTTHVEKRVLNTWSRKQRQVFALVEGSRTSEHIATMLQQPPVVVEKVLDDLQAIGAIQR
jgi:hypothetical protein